MAEKRYNRLDNQSPVQSQVENTKLDVKRSAFDFSTIHSGNALPYALIPVDCFDVVPGENISISLANVVEFRNPTTRQILNGCRIYYHSYYNRLPDLWEGAKNWLDTGLSGNINLQRPRLIWTFKNSDSIVYTVNSCTPMSLLNFLGLPAEALSKNFPPLRSFEFALSSSSSSVSYGFDTLSNEPSFFPADCAFAYQRNWRDYYANRNLLQNNKMWFPDNEETFILSYGCTEAVALNYGDEAFSKNSFYRLYNLTGLVSIPNDRITSVTPEPNNPSTSVVSSDPVTIASRAPNLSGLKFRQFRGDRFSTALPFADLIRGEIPVLNVNSESYKSLNLRIYGGGSFSDSHLEWEFSPSGNNTVNLVTNVGGFSTGQGPGEVGVKIPASELTMNAIRSLETMTVFKERMARINSRDSYYNGFIEAQFGTNPKYHDRRGTYIGGCYQDFAFSSVTQMSESSDNSPLGTKAGQGVSSGNGNITHDFYCSDFGWIQTYMSIVPDVFYTQGVPRMFSKKTQLEMYFPLFNNLAPQYIKDQELFVSSSESNNQDVFAYEDRYSEYKSRPNRVSGFMSLSPEVAAYDSAKIMARRFTSSPQLNSQFVTGVPENVDMSVFTVTDEPPFDFSCGISVRRVSPMPYTAVPGAMSSNIHA